MFCEIFQIIDGDIVCRLYVCFYELRKRFRRRWRRRRKSTLRTQLINASGEAWTDRHEYGAGNSDGFIFHANGSVQWIDDSPSGTWRLRETGSWSLIGNDLTVSFGGFPQTRTLTFDGTTMDWGGWEFRRQRVSIDNGGKGGGITREQLITPSGQAWTDAHLYSVGGRDGFILNANGTASFITDNSNGTWTITESGNWSLNGNMLSIIGRNENASIGETLRWSGRWGGEFTLTNITMAGGGGGNITPQQIINASGEAWTDRHKYGVGYTDGFIFRASGEALWIDDWRGSTEGVWQVRMESTWSLDGDILTAFDRSARVSISGNALFWDGWEMRRTSVPVNIVSFAAENQMRSIEFDEHPKRLNRKEKNRINGSLTSEKRSVSGKDMFPKLR